MDKIDVCIPTKNKDILDLKRMNLDILPINKIIVSDVKGLANARNDLMYQVTTEWFAFIDDDVKINEDWWDKIKSHIENHPEPKKLGAVNGFGLSKSWILKFIRFMLLKIRGDSKQRAFTSNTVIRTKAVEDIVLKRKGRLEDLELQERIKKKGYTWEFCQDARCVHMKSSWVVFKEALGDFRVLCRERGFWKAIRTI